MFQRLKSLSLMSIYPRNTPEPRRHLVEELNPSSSHCQCRSQKATKTPVIDIHTFKTPGYFLWLNRNSPKITKTLPLRRKTLKNKQFIRNHSTVTHVFVILANKVCSRKDISTSRAEFELQKDVDLLCSH